MSDLDTALDRAAVATERAAEDSRLAPVDPAIRAALAEAAGAPATTGERAIAARVRLGLLDWDDVWRDPPGLGPDGVRLVQRALVVAAREIRRESP